MLNVVCASCNPPAILQAFCGHRAMVLSRLRSGLSIHLGSLSFEGQGAFAT